MVLCPPWEAKGVAITVIKKTKHREGTQKLMWTKGIDILDLMHGHETGSSKRFGAHSRTIG